MLWWWDNLGRKGQMYFWGCFGLGVNGLLYLFGMWMPKLLIVAIALIIVAFLIPSDWDD